SITHTIERKEEVCDPSKVKPCKGYGEVCLTDRNGRSRCICANNGTRVDGVCLGEEIFGLSFLIVFFSSPPIVQLVFHRELVPFS
ncbi:unnamed protein product, partial [Anisakis simplex]|uniref:EGF-like domain-containing protein n=1 Tax=Anisakis simplex TaxID=6269 RepID=A0A0M3JHT9_ANISI